MSSPTLSSAVTGNAATVLVVAHEWDAVARDVVSLLRANSVAVATPTPTALCGGAVTYLSAHGNTMWASTVPGPSGLGDLTITSTELVAVLNRSVHLDPTGFADEDDESYAACERAALFTAMIESLECPVVNRSQGTTLAGPPHLEAEWMATAVRCGLTVQATSWTSDGVDLEPMRREVGAATLVGRQVLCTSPVGGVAEWTERHASRMIALGDQLGCELVRLSLGETADGRLVVTRIDPRPPHLEPSVVVSLAQHLTAGLDPIYTPEYSNALEFAS